MNAPYNLASPSHSSLSPGGKERAGVWDTPRNLIQEAVLLVLRRWRLLAGVFAGVALVAAVVQLIQPKLYTAHASIMVSPRPQQEVTAVDPAPLPTAPDTALVDSEIEFINSRFISEQIVDRFALVDDPAWNSALRPVSPISAGKKAIKSIISGGGNRQLSPEEIAEVQRQKTISAVDDAISANRYGLSYAVRISVTALSPRQAAEISNAVVDIYRETRDADLTAGAKRASLWLAERITVLREDLAKKEADVEDYRNTAGLFGADGELLIERKLRDAQRMVSQARVNLTDKEARLAQIEASSSSDRPVEALSQALTSEVIRDLRIHEAELRSEQADLEQRYGSQSPLVRDGRAVIAKVQQQIDEEIERIAASIEADVGVARRQLTVLEENLKTISAEMVADNAARVRLRELELEAESAREVYNGLVQRRLEIEGQDRYATANIRLLQEAASPLRPSSPNIPIALALSLSLGLGTSVLICLMLEQLNNDTTQFAEQLSEHTGYSVIASIPELDEKALGDSGAPTSYVVEKPASAYAEALRVLLQTIDAERREKRAAIVCLMSALPGDGKTTISLSLARLAAGAGRKVLLVDCDHRIRALNRLFSIEPKGGLHEVLSQQWAWRSLIVQDEKTGLNFLPSRASSEDQTFIEIDPKAMRSLLDDAAKEYDLILLDAPPVLSVAESRTIANFSDQTFLIARSRKTKIAAVQAAITQLNNSSIPVAGLILNSVNINFPGRVSYGDSLYYHESGPSYYGMREKRHHDTPQAEENGANVNAPIQTEPVLHQTAFDHVRLRKAGSPSTALAGRRSQS